jgi:tripartite-type tricarboxylate transporter receptor subunit TctC
MTTFHRRRILGSVACLGASALTPNLASTVFAQGSGSFPSRQLRIVTPFSPGQGPEVLLRLIAEKLQATWAQPVIVDNKPGAAGFIAFENAKQAPADGYTLVNMDSFHIGTQPHLFKKKPYDAFKDFEPITPLIRNYFFVAVPTESPWKSMTDLIAAAKAKAGGVAYGSWGVASPAHLGGALLESAAGLQMLHVPFKDPGQLYQSVATRQVDFAFATPISAKGMLDAGKLRLLAVAAPQRTKGFESIPTVAEAGGPAGFALSGWICLLAPAGTPADVIARLNESIRSAMDTPQIRDRLAGYTYEAFTMSPAQTRKTMEQEVAAWGPVIAKAGIKLD